jgi:transcription antitermination factor NusG
MTGGSQLVATDSVNSNACIALGSWQWYAIRTRSRHEKIVVRQLAQQQIQAFLPLATSVSNWSDRRKKVELPLFPGYTFVRIVYSPDERVRVLRAHGDVSFVGNHREAIPIPDAEIESIRTLLIHQVPLAPPCIFASRAEGTNSGGAAWTECRESSQQITAIEVS